MLRSLLIASQVAKAKVFVATFKSEHDYKYVGPRTEYEVWFRNDSDCPRWTIFRIFASKRKAKKVAKNALYCDEWKIIEVRYSASYRVEAASK